jgi:hypothetical protein
MADTVYLFGAGINRGLDVAPFSDSYKLKPPLATDFFQQALRVDEIVWNPDYHQNQFEALYRYIERYWKLSFDNLKTEPLNLEECFTLIQQQRLEARKNQNRDEYERLLLVEQQLVFLLRHLLSKFDTTTLSDVEWPPETAGQLSYRKNALDFKHLAELIVEESAVVLSFNYDLLLESALEENSHGQEDPFRFPYGDIRRSHFPWNAPRAYGFRFHDVTLHQSGPPNVVSGDAFYALPEHQLYDPPLLKLHGSLNWAAYTRFRRDWEAGGLVEDDTQEGKILIQYHPGPVSLREWEWPDYSMIHDQWVLKPLIVTPVLNKDLSRHPLSEIWGQARQELSNCSRLIVGGYSFMPTDFATRRLFLEAFADNTLDELVVINPNTEVVQLVKGLCHFQRPVLVCRDLGEFIDARN